MNDVAAEPAMPDGGRSKEKPARWGCALTGIRAVFAIVCIAGVAVLYVEGILFNSLVLLVLIMAAATLVHRLWHASRHGLELGLIRHPLRKPMRPYLLQCLNRWMFWGTTAAAIQLSLVPIQLDPAEYRTTWALIGCSLVALAVFQVIPPRRIRILGNVVYALLWVFLAVECTRIVAYRSPAARVTVISPPFRGEWYVMQGGASALVNHHYLIPGQSDALDLVKVIDGRSMKGDPTRLDSYFAYGQPLFAPGDGRVTRAINDRPDMAIGQSDIEHLAGNHVVIDVGEGRYVMMAHLMNGSISVSEGEQVRRGQPIAKCGNSGNTSEPHLHLQVQSAPAFDADHLSTFPIALRDVERVRWGRRWRGTMADFRRNDRIIPISAPE